MAQGSSAASGSKEREATACGYVFHELMMWHNPGIVQDALGGLQPTPHYEDVETKRRIHNLLAVSGLLDSLVPVKARPAAVGELTRVHAPDYVERVAALSADATKGCHNLDHEASLSPGGYEIAALAAGGGIALVDAALDGRVTTGYALTRPPGHHAERSAGKGYCIFNNVAVAAAHALEARGLSRVAIVDWDVHHGNGTQQIFWEDERVLFISIHQDSNYPIGSGPMSDVGAGKGVGTTLNVPLPPGSGSGAYRAVFDRVVAPALDAFAPQLILVSSGFDAAFRDPLSAQMVLSSDYSYFAQVLRRVAAKHCAGRVLGFHEGGYSPLYTPFCGLACIEALSGIKTKIVDPELAEHGERWGYQALQPWQDEVIRRAEAGPLALLLQHVAACAQGTPPAAKAAAAAGGDAPGVAVPVH